MCLALPGELIRIEDRRPPDLTPEAASGDRSEDAALWRVGLVEFSGVRREVSLACVPEARVGDRLLVHVGFALGIVHDDPDCDAPSGARP
jgi:hydrogenase expression/formation protein HypC